MFRLRGLPLQLFALAILPLIALLLLIAFGGLTLHQNAMRVLVAERDQRAARTAATAISEQLDHRAAAVQGLALRGGSAAEAEAALAQSTFLLPDFEGGFALLTPDATVMAATHPQTEWLDWPGLSGLVRSASLGAAPQFSPVVKNAVTDEALMLVAASGPRGAAVGAFLPIALARRALADAFANSDQAAAFLVDGSGAMLYHTGADIPLTPDLTQHPGVVDALRGESGSSYMPGADGEHVVAFSPVPSVGWALVIEEPWEAVSNPWLRTTQAAPLVMIPALLFSLVALWFGAKQIVEPLHKLAQQATQLGWGRYDAVEEPVGGIAEIRRLQSELTHMARKVQAAQHSLRGYVGAITAGQEEERRRLARELHDDTVQSLIALNQRVQLAQLALDGHPAAESLAEVHEMATQAIDDVRRFTRALRPVYLEDLGLAPALDALARDTQKSLGVPVDFRVSGPERRLAPEAELTLYRIAQEALSNVARHAQATHASLQLAFEPAAVALTVEDDGRGFQNPESPSEFAPQGHFGLLGMHERAELIGARLEIDAVPGHGVRLRVTIPQAQ